jgi:hypothetical protein
MLQENINKWLISDLMYYILSAQEEGYVGITYIVSIKESERIIEYLTNVEQLKFSYHYINECIAEIVIDF